VVHEHVETAERAPRLDCDLLRAREIAEVGGPHARVGRELPTSLEDFFEAVDPPGDDADRRAPLGEDRRERGTDAGRRASHENLRSVDVHWFDDSCSAHEKMPFDIVEASSLARAPNTSARAACTPLSSGAAWTASS